jgi:cell wall-associated NlpC family hydrolase
MVESDELMSNLFIKSTLLLLMLLLLVSFSAQGQETLKQDLPPNRQQSQKIENTFYKPFETRKIIVQHAIHNLGRTYKWSGDSPSTGFDCSGLIVYTYQKVDIYIPRTVKAQFSSGKPVNKKKLKPGDLVFFKNPTAQNVYHVGIFIDKNTFVHAPGQGKPVSYGYLTNPYFKKYYIGSRTYL